MNTPKNQHYVPQFLLRNFRINSKNQIYAFDKTEEKSFKTNIRNIASENKFYNFLFEGFEASIEPFLSSFEGRLSALFNKILEEKNLTKITEEEKTLISWFILAQFFRSKFQKLNLEKMNNIINKRRESMGAKKHEPLTDNDITVLISKSTLKSYEYIPLLLSKSWHLFKAPENNPFFISDNPITLQNYKKFGPYGNLGLAVPGIEIYLPLSKNLALGFFCKSHEEIFWDIYKKVYDLKKQAPSLLNNLNMSLEQLENYKRSYNDGEPINMLSENIENFNYLQTMFSTRYIFSSNDNFSLIEKMISDNVKFKEPFTMKVG